MSIADLIRKMSEAGASTEVIALAVEAIEGKDMLIEAKRAAERDRKRRQRSGQSRDSHGTVTGHPPSPLSDKETSPTPPKEINSPPLPPAVMIGADDFENKILEAAGGMIHPHGAIVVGPILSLITAGADLEFDVLPAIRATVARMSHPARSWSYFVPAIQAAFDRRIAAGKWESSTRAQPPPKLTHHQQRHKAAMNAFDRQLGIKPDDEPASNIIDLEGRDFRSL